MLASGICTFKQKLVVNIFDLLYDALLYTSRSNSIPSGHKTFLRHLLIVYKLSCPEKTYIRCLQDDLTENDCKCTHACLGKTSNRHLIKIYTSDISKTSFNDIFKTDFFKFPEKNTFIFMFIHLV